MPASKCSHVLSVLRKNLALRQTELAKMVGCSVNTITSVEVGRLKLSESLAKRIAAVTGCDEHWLLANDASVPMPKLPSFIEGAAEDPGGAEDSAFITQLANKFRDQAHIFTIYLLLETFSRLFAEVRKLEKTNVRNALENCIRKELEILAKTQTAPNARPLYSASRQTLERLRKDFKLPTELSNLGINLKHLIDTAPDHPVRPDKKERAKARS